MNVSLKAEGWKEDQRLPKGWMMKRRKSNAPRVKVSDTSNANNNEKIEESRLQFLNEEAEVMSAADSLEQLISQNHSEEDLQVFRALLADVTTRMQNAGKKKKECAKAKKFKQQEEKCVLKDDDRDIKLCSENASVNCKEAEVCPGNVFSQNLEMEVTENLNEMANVTKEKKMETVERQEDGVKCIMKINDSAEQSGQKSSWTNHPLLPEGWMMKALDSGKKIIFQTKDKTRMSVLAALRFMKSSPEFGPEETHRLQQIIKEFRPKTSDAAEHLNHSEWTSHPKLPAGFQVKLLPTKGKLLFRADENSPGLGKFAVIKSMMSIDKYKSEDADAIKVVAEELEDQLVNLLFNPQHNEKSQKKKIVEEAVWISDDPTVPTGWKISPDSGRFGRCLLSPDGVQMRNRCLQLRNTDFIFHISNTKYSFHIFVTGRGLSTRW